MKVDSHKIFVPYYLLGSYTLKSIVSTPFYTDSGGALYLKYSREEGKIKEDVIMKEDKKAGSAVMDNENVVNSVA